MSIAHRVPAFKPRLKKLLALSRKPPAPLDAELRACGAPPDLATLSAIISVEFLP